MTSAEFKAAFDQHKDAVYRFAWRMTGSADLASDVTQDVFLELLRAPARYDPARGTLKSFLFGVARNLDRKHLHQESRWTFSTKNISSSTRLNLLKLRKWLRKL